MNRGQKFKLLFSLLTCVISLVLFYLLHNSLYTWKYGDEQKERELVYIPIQLEETPQHRRIAIPKFTRGRKYVKFSELSKVCQYEGSVINCPAVHLQGETVMRQGHLVILRILRIFDLIAKKYSIPYWLLRGTLLGAYRAGEMISHDNDVDVGMMKEDYRRFEKIIRKELPSGFFFQDGSDEPGYPNPKHVTAKIRDLNSCYTSCHNCKWNDGLMLDIFVFEKMNNRLIAEIEQQKGIFPITSILPVGEIEFEGMKLGAPHNIESILSITYGSSFATPSENYPADDHVANPWYSCKYIDSSPDRNAIIAELKIR